MNMTTTDNSALPYALTALQDEEIKKLADEKAEALYTYRNLIRINGSAVEQARVLDSASVAFSECLQNLRAITSRGLFEDRDAAKRMLGTAQAERNKALDDLGDALAKCVDVLEAQATAQATVVIRDARVESLERDLHAARREFDLFKLKVVQVASEAADEHGWCGEIDSCLEELGLERESKRYKANLTIEVEFDVERTDSRDVPSDSWVKSSIRKRNIEQAIEEMFDGDSDHDGLCVNNINFEVDDVKDIDED